MIGKKIKLNLAWKFLLAISLLILLIIPITAYFFTAQSLRVLNNEVTKKVEILKENLRKKGTSMTKNIALNISNAVAGSDFTFIQNIISSTVAADKEIRFGIIVNDEGRAIIHSDPLSANQILNSPQDIKSREVNQLTVFEYRLDNEDLIEVAVPIMFGEERWGTLRVAYTLQYLKEELQKSLALQAAQQRSLTRSTVLITALSMLLASLLALLFSHHIVKAIRTIMRVTQQVARGDFTPRAEVHTGDELEVLGNAINQMTENLDKLNQEYQKKARIEGEMMTAEIVQKNILPQKDPKFPGIEFSSYLRSASMTAGDWFNYAFQPKENTLLVIIADVTGHGLPAALLTEAASSCFRTINTLNPRLSPQEILKLLNQVLTPQMYPQFGMTAFLSRLDLSTNKMSYSNAGHNMPLVYRENNEINGKRFQVLSARGPRLGDSELDDFEEKEIQLTSGMALFWYTDGLLDCVNDYGEFFCKKRLLRVLRESAHGSSTTIRDSVVDELMRFTGGTRPPDDITFIVGKVL